MQNQDPKFFSVIRLVDDDEELLESFRFLLEGDGWFVRTYNCAESFLERDNLKIPGCAIVDIRMDGMSGLELQDTLKDRQIKMPLIFLSGHATVENVVDTLESGAVTFLSKPATLDKLRPAVDKAMSFAQAIHAKEALMQSWMSLTAKEKEVARLISEGLLNKQIADRLSIAERTVQAHRTNVYHKLDAKNAIDIYKVLSELGV